MRDRLPLIHLTLKFAVIMSVQFAGHDLFAIWLLIMDVSVEEIFRESSLGQEC